MKMTLPYIRRLFQTLPEDHHDQGPHQRDTHSRLDDVQDSVQYLLPLPE